MLLRGQALLLLVVGILVGTVLGGIVMAREGLPAPLAARVADFVAPPHSGLPASIEVSPSPGGVTAGLHRTGPLITTPSPTPSHTARPAPSPGQVTVVPPPVYTYYNRGHGGGDDSGSGGRHG